MASSSYALTLGDASVRQLDGLFSLNDLHAAAGGERKHQPAFFMRREETRALIAELNHSANSQSDQCSDSSTALRVINGGTAPGTYACRELVIAYAAWISAAFHLKVIRVFLATQAPPQLHQNAAITDVAFAVANCVLGSVYRALRQCPPDARITRRLLVEVSVDAKTGQFIEDVRHIREGAQMGTWAELAGMLRAGQVGPTDTLEVAAAAVQAQWDRVRGVQKIGGAA